MPRLFMPRKLTKNGDSLSISIPVDLIRTYSLKEGDYLTIIFDSEIDNALGDQYVIVVDVKGRQPQELHKFLDKLFE